MSVNSSLKTLSAQQQLLLLQRRRVLGAFCPRQLHKS